MQTDDEIKNAFTPGELLLFMQSMQAWAIYSLKPCCSNQATWENSHTAPGFDRYVNNVLCTSVPTM
jgi:hypothetical protein